MWEIAVGIHWLEKRRVYINILVLAFWPHRPDELHRVGPCARSHMGSACEVSWWVWPNTPRSGHIPPWPYMCRTSHVLAWYGTQGHVIQPKKFSSRGAAVHTASTPPLLNFWTLGKPCGLNDTVPWAGSGLWLWVEYLCISWSWDDYNSPKWYMTRQIRS